VNGPSLRVFVSQVFDDEQGVPVLLKLKLNDIKSEAVQPRDKKE
jgi:hypothetical protein